MTAVTELDHAHTEDLVVTSVLLGSLATPAEQLYRFDGGIYGFPDARTFALIPAESRGFFWLQSVERGDLTFLVVDPFSFVPDYVVDLDPAELGDLEGSHPTDILLLSIVTLPSSPGATATLNLQGPLALDVARKRGKQVVSDTSFGVRHPVDLARHAKPSS